MSLYLTYDDYWSIWKNKLSKFGKRGCGVKIACITAFRSRIASYPDKRDNTQKEYTEYYAYIGLKQIKILDRVHSSTQKIHLNIGLNFGTTMRILAYQSLKVLV